MTAPDAPAPGAFAFSQGIDRDAVLRLLAGRFTRADYRLYLRCDHWQATRAQAFDVHGRACCLCDSPLGLAIHHRPSGYRHLFREDVRTHLVVVCASCHRRHHRR